VRPPYLLVVAASTVATMPARTAGESDGQARTIRAKSGSIGAGFFGHRVSVAPDSAAL